MTKSCTRRQVLIAGAALALVGCGNRHRGLLEPNAPAPYAPQPPMPAVATPRGGTMFIVKPGDTLSSISRRSGLSVSQIAKANKLDSTVILPGQRLWLPNVHTLRDDPVAERIDRAREARERALAGHYDVIPRSNWAEKPMRKNRTPMDGIKRITVHHTGEHKGMVGLSDKEVVQQIERYHRDNRKWSSIGYHFVIGRDGNVFEGRPLQYQGAHVSSHNPHNLGISCIGDFDTHMPTTRQLGTLLAFLTDQRSRFGVSLKHVYGHKDLGPTICPGRKLYAWLKDYKAGRV